MAKRKPPRKEKPPKFKPWAEIWEDLDEHFENRWFIRYCVVEGKVNNMVLDAEDLDSALMEAAGICGLDESQIQH